MKNRLHYLFSLQIHENNFQEIKQNQNNMQEQICNHYCKMIMKTKTKMESNHDSMCFEKTY